MRNLLFIILLLGASLTAMAQNNQSRIVDLDGNGVAGVEIEGRSSCAPSASPGIVVTKTVITDAEGRFTWPEEMLSAGSNCVRTLLHTHTLKKDGYAFTKSSFFYRPDISQSISLFPAYDDRLPVILATNSPIWTNVSAARFGIEREYLGVRISASHLLASEMIVAGFGTNLAATTGVAGQSLPTTLAGRRIVVRDSASIDRAAQLIFVAPTQINYVMPSGLADGPAQIRLLDENNNLIKVGLVEIKKVVPGVFTANADGKGVPAGLIVRVKPGNVQSYEPIAQFDPQQQKFIPLEIDLGPEDEFLVLALFGTGWRQVNKLEDVQVSIIAAGPGPYINCPVEYVGQQPTFAGLDQINARLPRSLLGKGDVVVSVSINGFSNFYLGLNGVTLKFK